MARQDQCVAGRVVCGLQGAHRASGRGCVGMERCAGICPRAAFCQADFYGSSIVWGGRSERLRLDSLLWAGEHWVSRMRDGSVRPLVNAVGDRGAGRSCRLAPSWERDGQELHCERCLSASAAGPEHVLPCALGDSHRGRLFRAHECVLAGVPGCLKAGRACWGSSAGQHGRGRCTMGVLRRSPPGDANWADRQTCLSRRRVG